MRINEPNTNNEVMLSDDSMIVSKTDLKGIITMVNAEFVKISGYTEAELIGKNHNILRHSDMPAIAFQGLWDDIKQGKPWTGLVKNRCKNGDFYWVRANVTPVSKNGRVVEYMSVRSKPGRVEVDQAAELYRNINNGKLPKPSLLHRLNIFSKFKVWQKLFLTAVMAFLAIIIISTMLIVKENKEVSINKSELNGIEYINATRLIMQNLPQHRGMTNAYLNGNKALKAKILAKRAEVDSDFERLQGIDDQFGQQLKINGRLDTLRSEWNALKSSAFNLKAKESFSRHTQMLERIIKLTRDVSVNSHLSLDSELDSSYLIDLLVNKIPVLTEKMGQSRGLGSGVIAKKGFTPAQKEKLIKLGVLSEVLIDGINLSLDGAFESNGTLRLELEVKANRLKSSLLEFNQKMSKLIQARFDELNSGQFFKDGTAAINSNFDIYDDIKPLLVGILRQRIENLEFKRNLLIAGVIFVISLVLIVGFVVIKDILRALQETAEEFEEIKSGNYQRNIELSRSDEIGDLLRSLKSMQIMLGYDVNDARSRANDMQRIKVALDNVSGNVMMADINRTIIYMNKSVVNMMQDAESDIKKELPDFNVSQLLGTCIDTFHKNPPHQEGLLRELDATYGARIQIGGRTFDLAANPVINDEGERLGTAVEWLDRTAEVAVEKEIEDIVNAAQQGDLDKRLDVLTKSGFFRGLSEGINQLIEVVASTFKDVARTMQVLSEGDLTQ